MTTNAFSRWPNSSSSTPITATSLTASWSASRSSTSRGKTFSPPETIISSSRPSMNRRPVVVEVADVAGGEQALVVVLAAAAGVALERHLVADEDAPGLALRDLALALGVDDLDHRPARRQAGGPGRGAQVLGRRDRRPGDLGRAVEVVEVVAEVVHPLRRQLARAAPSRWPRSPAGSGRSYLRASPRRAGGSAASSPGRRRARSRSFSAIAFSVSSGSNLRRRT